MILGLNAQNYEIDFLGIPWVAVTMDHSVTGQLDFQTKTLGLIDSIWPVDNNYSTKYDPSTGAVQSHQKKINQGSYHNDMEFVVDENGLITYNDEIKIQRSTDTQTIFTMLARINQVRVKDLDGVWFPMEHEGQLYRMRLLWADKEELEVDSKTFNCDHFRLDIEPTEMESVEIPASSDYFTDYIVHPDCVRQLWVSKKDPRKIIQASVKLFGFTLTAKIKDE